MKEIQRHNYLAEMKLLRSVRSCTKMYKIKNKHFRVEINKNTPYTHTLEEKSFRSKLNTQTWPRMRWCDGVSLEEVMNE
jgi:uncharacterized protein YqiB (DUF1249 family)